MIHDDSDLSDPLAERTEAMGEAMDSVSERKGIVSSSQLMGSRLGNYQILRKLGRGGMADVYAARDLILGREVAIKVLRSDFASDETYVNRFRREAKAAAKLNHPNIIQIYEVGNVDSFHYIAQELVDGDNLRQVITRSGAVSADEAIEVLMAVGSALEVAAEARITHRDIKPENIMRSSRGIIKVADFGLARVATDSVDATRSDLTQVGLTLGTPRYMSPEQIQGHVVDVRSDLYSLGISMYHLIAGRPPFEAEDPLALAVMHLHEIPAPLDLARGSSDVPEWLIAIVAKLIRKRPEDRFQSPSEVLAAIHAQTISGGTSAVTIGTAAATVRLQRIVDESRQRNRRKALKWTGAVAAVMIGIIGTCAAMLSRPPKSVTQILRPDQVPQATSVEEQYLIAVVRNDEAGWSAVSDYFPPVENQSLHIRYYAKSQLQMARQMQSDNQWRAAEEVLRRLSADPKIDRLYRTLALVSRCEGLKQLDRPELLQETQAQLQAAYKELHKTNSSAAIIFDRVVPEKTRSQLGLTL
ncbi:Serine/threonine-protein kinase PrkC [Novipirellula aureliae]|uniref:non-specific serine/threonine protein kinase n=1 Tax=Novipirellula aureliae TaxID=2527966 RepID=A0A5C6E5S7_9BACT|nr:protein kinase [Novipirellula aureliae]TWU43904.1 Serine/threonine-protein kinase PrkC [Novipirellula aureliae]